MKLTRPKRWVAIGSLAIAVGVIAAYRSSAPTEVSADLSAIKRMGITPSEDAEAVRVRYESRFSLSEQLVIQARHDRNALKAIIGNHNWNLPEPDRREYLAAYLAKDLALYKDPSEVIHISYSDQGVWQDFKNKVIEPTEARRLVLRDIHLWRRIFESCPPGPLDFDTAGRITKEVYESRTPDHTDFKDFHSPIEEAISMTSLWGFTVCDRRLRLTAAHIYLTALETGSLPKELPDYGEVSREPLTSAPFRYSPKSNGFELESIGPYAAKGSIYSMKFPFP